jgi:hypothetical protein
MSPLGQAVRLYYQSLHPEAERALRLANQIPLTLEEERQLQSHMEHLRGIDAPHELTQRLKGLIDTTLRRSSIANQLPSTHHIPGYIAHLHALLHTHHPHERRMLGRKRMFV